MNDDQLLPSDYENRVKTLLKQTSLCEDDIDVLRWMHTSRPEWNNLSPTTMITLGRSEPVIRYLETQLK